MMLSGDVKAMTKKLDELLEVTAKLQEDVSSLQQQKTVLQRQPKSLTAAEEAQGASPARRRSSTPVSSGVSSVSSGVGAGGSGGELMPVLEGDYLVIRDVHAETQGCVTGDASTRACGVQLAEAEDARRPSKSYDDYVFQVGGGERLLGLLRVPGCCGYCSLESLVNFIPPRYTQR